MNFSLCLGRLLFYALILLSTGIRAQEPFRIYGKFMIDGGNLSESKIRIEKNGKQVALHEVSKAKFDFPLEYDSKYVFSFLKPGYITKKIEVNTSVPKEKQSLEFEPFKFDVEIFQQYEGINTVIYNQPVGKILFNDVLNEFDYDTDYTKSIQSALAEVEEQIKERIKEEARKKKEQEKLKEQEEKQKLEEQKKKAEELTKAAKEKEKSEAPEKKKSPPIVAEIKKEPESKLENKVKPPPAGNKTAAASTKTTQRDPIPKNSISSGVITMMEYTAAVYGYPQVQMYGWINFGDGTGIREIATREEFYNLKRQYFEK